MKKLSLLVAIASLGAFVACGPSAEEKAATEKAKQDSITAVEAAKAAEEAAKAQAMADSTAAYSAAEAEKIKAEQEAKDAAAKKGGSKPKPATKTIEEQKKEDVKKVTGGKG